MGARPGLFPLSLSPLLRALGPGREDIESTFGIRLHERGPHQLTLPTSITSGPPRDTLRYFIFSLALCFLGLVSGPAFTADLELPDLSDEHATAPERIVPRLAADIVAPWPSPESLREAGYRTGDTGPIVRVMLSILVDEEGEVDRIGVYESDDPGEIYVQAAMRAAETATFHPGREGSAPQRMWTLLCIDFPSY